MNNDNALISTAILTAIWNESHKDNIELIKPFVLDIIDKKYSINEEINEMEIIELLKENYCFDRFPIAVLKVVLTRLKKDGILKANNKKLILVQNLKEKSKVFDDRKSDAKKEISEIISHIKEYLSTQMNKKISQEDAEKYLESFISFYGYNTYENINITKTIDRKREYINYLIGEFICSEEKKNSNSFKIILKVIEGYMIANAIYLQIENDNKASLKKLTCYLDSPFILRVFGYKTDEENKSAKELYDLLIKYGATIKCFKHTYNEVYNILNFYKNHIGKSKEITLEYFDDKNYTEGQIDLLLSSLESKFQEFKIIIEEKPEFVKLNEKYVIDYKGLEEKLISHKEHKNSYFSENTIMNDVDSVCAINILRKGKKSNKIENCGYIFVTTYQYLKIASKEIMTELDDIDIGLVIDDLDLTTILWFKDFKKNPNLPKFKLIENALAATNATDEIIQKAIPIYESIKKDYKELKLENVSNCLTRHYLKASGFIDIVKNDPDLVTKESMVEFLSKKDMELKQKEKELEDTKKRNLQIKNNIQNNFIKEAEEIAEKNYKKLKKKLNFIYYTMGFIIFLLCIVSIIYGTSSCNIIFKVTITIISIISLFDMILPKSKYILRKIDKYCLNKKRDEISIKTDKILEKMNYSNEINK